MSSRKSLSPYKPKASRSTRKNCPAFKFSLLVKTIAQIHDHFARKATRAVNVNLTARNWVIGWYIEEYVCKGVDRAKYGKNLIGKLADTLQGRSFMRTDRRELYRFHKFYDLSANCGDAVSTIHRHAVGHPVHGQNSGDSVSTIASERCTPHAGSLPFLQPFQRANRC